MDHSISHGFLFFLFFLIFNSIISTNDACDPSERSALTTFSRSLSSPPLNWTTDSVDCCQWEGITCNQDLWITRLQLPSKGLNGGIISPTSLGNLTHLTHLNLSHNSLYGSLEARFFLSLNRLEILDLSYNLLSGELSLSQLPSNVQIVDLSSNHFHGEIPSLFFGHASNMTSFNVTNNSFSGSIPSSICLHLSPSIRLFDFSLNGFSGNISRGLGACSKLQVFRAGYNNLSGLLPDDIYNATTLQEIALPRNSLQGAISKRIVNLTNLAFLDLQSNGLSGFLPVNIGKLSKLQHMFLQFNSLKGSLPPSLMNCTNLIKLNLGINLFEGNISTLNFSNLTKLTILDLGHNNFTGFLPTTLYSCKSPKAIRVSKNNLEGQIQPEILSLKSLSFLSLSYSRLTNITGAMRILMRCKSLKVLILSTTFYGEKIPSDEAMANFDGFQNLQMLDLSNCQLNGEIPQWLSKLKKLGILILNFNRITGSIPSWLGALPRLFVLGLGANRISGEFPRELCTLPMLLSEGTSRQADDDVLELPIYTSTNRTFMQYKLSYFPRVIDLKNNSISGRIPIEIGQLQLIQKLDLNMNNFLGEIPEQISNLKNLEELDLSMNHFSGKIPLSLASLSFLNSFNVSYNNLEGSIPTGTQLQSFNASAFEGNPKLCGPPLPKCLSSNGNDGENKKSQDLDDESLWIGLSVVLGFVVGFLGFCCPLLLKRTWRYAYFQFLDDVQFKLYLVQIKVRRRMKVNKQPQDQVQVSNQKGEVESSSHSHAEGDSKNCTEDASPSNSFMVPHKQDCSTSVFNDPIQEEIQSIS
nr:receptor-like protein 2 [Malus domestica]